MGGVFTIEGQTLMIAWQVQQRGHPCNDRACEISEAYRARFPSHLSWTSRQVSDVKQRRRCRWLPYTSSTWTLSASPTASPSVAIR